MLNQIVLVGRLTRDIRINKTDSGKKVATLSLAVPRSFKNMDGIYDTDYIDCILWENTAINTSEYCHKGDIVGIKGRIQSRLYEEGDTKRNVLEVVAEKVTFLSSKNPQDKEEKIEADE